MAVEGDVGGREILAEHPEDILTVEMNTDAITKIWEPAPSPSFSLFCSSQFPMVKEWITGKLGSVPYLVVAREKLGKGRYFLRSAT